MGRDSQTDKQIKHGCFTHILNQAAQIYKSAEFPGGYLGQVSTSQYMTKYGKRGLVTKSFIHRVARWHPQVYCTVLLPS